MFGTTAAPRDASQLMLGATLALLMQKVDPAAAGPAAPPDPMGQYLADLEKAGILTGTRNRRRWSA